MFGRLLSSFRRAGHVLLRQARGRFASACWRFPIAPPKPRVGAVFAAELAKQGFVLGSNLVIERRFSHMDGLDSAASALAALKVDVIYARGTQAALAAKRATSSIPIVFMSADPVGFGLVSSLPRPGGNLTGVSIQGPAITAKEMEAMLGALGTLRSLAYIHPIGARAVPWYPSSCRAGTSAAKTLGVWIEFHEVAGVAAYEPLIQELARRKIDAAELMPVQQLSRSPTSNMSRSRRCFCAIHCRRLDLRASASCCTVSLLRTCWSNGLDTL